MKKKFIEVPGLTKFLAVQSQDVLDEYRLIVRKLEDDGRLNMPLAEKVDKTLFAIRVLVITGNVRVFYVYGLNDYVYGIHGYVKKTRKIPDNEIKTAYKIVKILKAKNII